MMLHRDQVTRLAASSRAPGVLASVLFLVLSAAMLVSLPLPRRVQAARPAAPSPPAMTVTTPAAAPFKLVPTPIGTYSARKARAIDTVVVHYMSGINVDASRWDDPALSRQILLNNRVSAHYLVARDGTVYRLVDERNVAWHAGGSIMPAPDNRRNVNAFSIGIEMIATAKSGFTEAQYAALQQLIGEIRARHPIRHVVGHDEIGGRRAVQLGLRRDVKPDPGPLFDWSRVR